MKEFNQYSRLFCHNFRPTAYFVIRGPAAPYYRRSTENMFSAVRKFRFAGAVSTNSSSLLGRGAGTVQSFLFSSAADGAKLIGTVKFFDKKRGFGMVTSDVDKKDYFFHRTKLAGWDSKAAQRNIYVDNGETVEFIIEPPEERYGGRSGCSYVGGVGGTKLKIWTPRPLEG